MTAKEFWEDDPALFWSYRISYIRRKKNEQEVQNSMLWLQGAYFYDAVTKALANAFSKGKKYTYLEKPLDFGGKEIKTEVAKEKARDSNTYWASFKHMLSNKQE